MGGGSTGTLQQQFALHIVRISRFVFPYPIRYCHPPALPTLGRAYYEAHVLLSTFHDSHQTPD